LLTGYNSELDTLDSNDEQDVPNELQLINEEGTKYNTAYFGVIY